MIKVDKLKGKILENRKTYQECANNLGISKTTFQNKISNITDFTIPEARNLSDYLNLTIDERIDIFML